MTDTFQWERCNSGGTSCVDILGATGPTYTQVAADVGKTIRVRGTRDGTLVGESAATAIVAGPITPPPPGNWSSFYNVSPPAFSPSRTVNVSTQSALMAAIQGALGGDLVNYTGGTLSGEFGAITRNGPLAVVNLNGAHFAGTPAGSRLPAFYLKGAGGLRFLNFGLSNPGGDGLWVQDANTLEFWGFVVSNCGGQGIHLLGASKACDGVLLHGEVTNCGLDLAQDPHVDKGSGLHGFYSGGSSFPVTNGDWTLYVHDQARGAAMEINRTRNTHIALKAVNCTYVARSQAGGNALQPWATSAESSSTWNDNITVDYLEASNVARVVETVGMEAGSLANSKVLVGRGTNVRLSPAYATSGHAGMQYIDCTP